MPFHSLVVACIVHLQSSGVGIQLPQQIVLVSCYEHKAGFHSHAYKVSPCCALIASAFWHNSARPARWLTHKGNSLSDSFWNFPSGNLFLFWIFLGSSINAKKPTTNARLPHSSSPPPKKPLKMQYFTAFRLYKEIAQLSLLQAVTMSFF